MLGRTVLSFFIAASGAEIYTLSLHDALPICGLSGGARARPLPPGRRGPGLPRRPRQRPALHVRRSEEHTSELQSPYDLVCRLLLEKKNQDRDDDKHADGGEHWLFLTEKERHI